MQKTNSQKKIKVLLVDDLIENHDYARMMLYNTEFELDCVRTGKECLSIFSNYHVILMDLVLENESGSEIAKLIHSKQETTIQSRPLIFSFSADIPDSQLLSYFDDYLLKPINQQKLMNKIISRKTINSFNDMNY